MDLEDILRRIEEGGWAVYELIEGDTADGTISRGRAEGLEYGKSYCIIPKIEEHNNIEAVKKVVDANKEKLPVIGYKGKKIALFCIRLTPEFAEIADFDDSQAIGYEDFYEALKYLSVSPTCLIH